MGTPPAPPRKERRTTAVWSGAVRKAYTAPAHPAVERLRNKMRGVTVPARSITGTDTPLRQEKNSQAEAAGVSRPGRAARRWPGAVTIALRGDRSIVTVPQGGIPSVHPHGGARNKNSQAEAARVSKPTTLRNNRRNEASRACSYRDKTKAEDRIVGFWGGDRRKRSPFPWALYAPFLAQVKWPDRMTGPLRARKARAIKLTPSTTPHAVSRRPARGARRRVGYRNIQGEAPGVSRPWMRQAIAAGNPGTVATPPQSLASGRRLRLASEHRAEGIRLQS